MPTSEQPIRRLTVSWQEFDRQSRLLAAAVKGLRPWQGIVAIARGGLIPAAIVAYELDLRLVDTLCISTYDDQNQRAAEILKTIAGDGENMLVVEDIVDTGVTARIVREMLPKCYFAAVFAKPQGAYHADRAMVEVAQDMWVDFPWDMPVDLAESVGG